MKGVNSTAKAEREIVEILHKNKIPLALIPTVFSNVNQLIAAYTVPYSPSCLSTRDLPISEMTDSVTEPHQQSECSRRFCEMLLEKCKNEDDSFDVMGERNEWARMLSRLEKIGDLPDINTMEKIADAFQKSLAAFIAFTCTHGSLSGDESIYLISDGIRNYSRLEEILSRMKHQDTSHSETSGGAS